MTANYFTCPRCGQVHDVDPRPSGTYQSSSLPSVGAVVCGVICADGWRCARDTGHGDDHESSNPSGSAGAVEPPALDPTYAETWVEIQRQHLQHKGRFITSLCPLCSKPDASAGAPTPPDLEANRMRLVAFLSTIIDLHGCANHDWLVREARLQLSRVAIGEPGVLPVPLSEIVQLDELAARPELRRQGWDTYNGDPLTDAAVAAARKFLGYRWAIVPTSDGGLQLERHDSGVDIEITFNADGTLEGMFAKEATLPAPPPAWTGFHPKRIQKMFSEPLDRNDFWVRDRATNELRLLTDAEWDAAMGLPVPPREKG